MSETFVARAQVEEGMFRAVLTLPYQPDWGKNRIPGMPESLNSASAVIPARAGMYCIHFLDSGLRRNDETRAGGNRNPLNTPASPSSATCSRRRSITCIHAGVSINDSEAIDTVRQPCMALAMSPACQST